MKWQNGNQSCFGPSQFLLCVSLLCSILGGQDGACPQSPARPPPLSGHLSAVEPTAGAAQSPLGYGSLRTEKHYVTHLLSHVADYST